AVQRAARLGRARGHRPPAHLDRGTRPRSVGRADRLMNPPEPQPLDAQVAVVGAAPVGMTLAGRLAQKGVRVVLLEQHPRLTGEGSKALCMQRETLEIWARLGIGEEVARRG